MKNKQGTGADLPSSRDATEQDDLVAPVPISAVIFLLLALAAAVIAYILPAAQAPPSHVRIRNDSGYPFREVVVDGQAFGNIDPGEQSEYRVLRKAYPTAQVRLVAAGHDFRLQPEDHFGEHPLGKGRFTYALKIVDVGSPHGLAISLEPEQR